MVQRSAPRARTTLIEQTVRAHDGEASVEYRTDGLTCEIKLPLPENGSAGGRRCIGAENVGRTFLARGAGRSAHP
jgi:hypothetical protein